MPTRVSLRLSAVALLAASSAMAYSPGADACACCADPGQRFEAVSTLQAHEKAELEKVRFSKKTKLFMNAAGAAGVQGIVDPSDDYELTQSRVGDRWMFTLKDAKGRTGTFSFTVPGQIESFFVDPRDGKADSDPVLYKEWRLSAPAVASGVFAPSVAAGAPKIRLVLQGRGNSCTSADQFTSYSIAASGPSASFTFYGALASPAP